MTQVQHKTLSIIQPSFLPWRGYFQIISQSDAFIFYDDVQYDKHGWRNRNQIKTAQGLQWITVPVLNKGKSQQLICEAQIDNTAAWTKKILKSIQVSYAKAPYFQFYFEWLTSRFQQKWDSISELDICLTQDVCKFLDLKAHFYKSSSLNIIHSDPTQRLVEICKHFSATTYISGPSAQNYIGDGQAFKSSGIELVYAKYELPSYEQLFGSFEQAASIIDLLFNQGPESKNFIISPK